MTQSHITIFWIFTYLNTWQRLELYKEEIWNTSYFFILYKNRRKSHSCQVTGLTEQMFFHAFPLTVSFSESLPASLSCFVFTLSHLLTHSTYPFLYLTIEHVTLVTNVTVADYHFGQFPSVFYPLNLPSSVLAVYVVSSCRQILSFIL